MSSATAVGAAVHSTLLSYPRQALLYCTTYSTHTCPVFRSTCCATGQHALNTQCPSALTCCHLNAQCPGAFTLTWVPSSRSLPAVYRKSRSCPVFPFIVLLHHVLPTSQCVALVCKGTSLTMVLQWHTYSCTVTTVSYYWTAGALSLGCQKALCLVSLRAARM
jgi:hypothetical protein